MVPVVVTVVSVVVSVVESVGGFSCGVSLSFSGFLRVGFVNSLRFPTVLRSRNDTPLFYKKPVKVVFSENP